VTTETRNSPVASEGGGGAHSPSPPWETLRGDRRRVLRRPRRRPDPRTRPRDRPRHRPGPRAEAAGRL